MYERRPYWGKTNKMLQYGIDLGIWMRKGWATSCGSPGRWHGGRMHSKSGGQSEPPTWGGREIGAR